MRHLLKDATVDALPRVVTTVRRGDMIFSPAIAQSLMRSFARQPLGQPPDLFPELTDRARAAGLADAGR